MSRNVQISAGLVLILALAILAITLTGGGSDDDAGAEEAPVATQSADGDPQVLRDDTRILGERGDSGVVFTEFLDFECESCRAAFPLVEQLREEYAGRVTFAMRYFPIDSHQNAMNAALAVESAGRQGKHEAMYKLMYETQETWGEQQESKAKLFRGFAGQIGLDMAAYDRDVKAPRTRARVERDRDEGVALGVQGTPTFFLNGSLVQASTPEELKQQIDAAIDAA